MSVDDNVKRNKRKIILKIRGNRRLGNTRVIRFYVKLRRRIYDIINKYEYMYLDQIKIKIHAGGTQNKSLHYNFQEFGNCCSHYLQYINLIVWSYC